MLVLKRVKGWSFDETEREVRKNLVYRHLTRVYFERVPDAKTLIRLSAVIGADRIETIHRRLVQWLGRRRDQRTPRTSRHYRGRNQHSLSH